MKGTGELLEEKKNSVRPEKSAFNGSERIDNFKRASNASESSRETLRARGSSPSGKNYNRGNSPVSPLGLSSIISRHDPFLPSTVTTVTSEQEMCAVALLSACAVHRHFQIREFPGGRCRRRHVAVWHCKKVLCSSVYENTVLRGGNAETE